MTAAAVVKSWKGLSKITEASTQIKNGEEATHLAQVEKPIAKSSKELEFSEIDGKNANSANNEKFANKPETEYDTIIDVDGPKKTANKKKPNVLPDKIKNRKDFKNPTEAYAYVRNLDSDIPKIRKLDLKVSEAEIDMTKKNVREWLPEGEYPGIDYSIIDQKLDKYAGKAFNEKELEGVKDYLFDNQKFKPPKNASEDLNDPFYNNAESWIRLANGKGNHADEILIKHEILETRLKYDLGLEEMGKKLGKNWYQTHSDCHSVSEEIFNYAEAIEGIK